MLEIKHESPSMHLQVSSLPSPNADSVFADTNGNSQVVAAHTLNSSLWEAEAGKFLVYRVSSSTGSIATEKPCLEKTNHLPPLPKKDGNLAEIPQSEEVQIPNA